jgi:hypothetical protein
MVMVLRYLPHPHTMHNVHRYAAGSCLNRNRTHPRELEKLHPGVLADGPVVMALQELAPLVNVLPPPVVCVQQLPHRQRGLYLQALLALLRSARSAAGRSKPSKSAG